MDTIDRIRTDLATELLLEAPFFGHLFSALPWRSVDEIEDLVLVLNTFRPEIWINAGAVAAMPADARLGAVKHELMHLVFRHVSRFADDSGHPVFYHLAADLVVNQYLTPKEQISQALTLGSFASLDLESDRELAYYREEVHRAWKRGVDPGAAWRNTVAGCLRGLHPALRRHDRWRPSAIGAAPGCRQVMKSLETALLRDVVRRVGEEGIGSLPGALRAALTADSLSPSTIDWRRRLRLFAARSRKTRLKYTIRRPSKRYGTTPGLQVTRAARLMCAVDTSGSIAPAQTRAFFREIHHLWRLGHEIMIVECDARIQRRYLYRGRMPEWIRGRGGTRFDPPIHWANEEYKPDGILYFTDGQGPPPSVISRSPLMWVFGLPKGVGPLRVSKNFTRPGSS